MGWEGRCRQGLEEILRDFMSLEKASRGGPTLFSPVRHVFAHVCWLYGGRVGACIEV